MSSGSKIIFAMALTSLLAITVLKAVQAGGSSLAWKPMKPLYAINFDVGRKHILSYFLSKNGRCDLTLMITDRPSDASPPKGDEIPILITSRFKAEIEGGNTAQFDTTEGASLEYACTTHGQTMIARKVHRVAAASLRRQNSE